MLKIIQRFGKHRRCHLQGEYGILGCPSPLLVNIFVTGFEVEAVDSSPMKLKCWRRYVDDTFAIGHTDKLPFRTSSSFELQAPQYHVFRGTGKGSPGQPIPGQLTEEHRL
jgi:hypothetical protein